MLMRRIVLLLASIALAAFNACPKPAQNTDARPPATAPGGTSEPASPVPSAPESPPQPAVEPDPPNPRPTGSNWLWAPKLRARVGQKLEVQYRMEQPNPGKAWIGLIPVVVTEKDAASNDAADVAFSYTVNAPEAALNLDLPQAGRFVLRLFSSSDSDAALLGESPVITVEQWPRGDMKGRVPPYATINQPPEVEHVEVYQGLPVPVYFEVPEGYPDKAWIGVVPVGVKSPQESDNDAADVQYWYLEGKTKDSFIWYAKDLGTFVYRLFPSDVAECEWVAESEPFTIVPNPHKIVDGKTGKPVPPAGG